MTRSALFLVPLFALLAAVEASFLWVFSLSWICTFPLMIIAGLLIMQRVGVIQGTAWCFAAALFQWNGVAFCIALLGPLFFEKVFSTRSVYALLGAGLAAYGTSLVLITLFSFLLPFFPSLDISKLFIGWILLVPGLYCGFLFVRWFEISIGSRFAIKTS